MTVSANLLQKSLPGDAVRIGMTIDNQGYNETIDSCHMYLYTPARNATYEEILEVYIYSDTPNIGFLDT